MGQNFKENSVNNTDKKKFDSGWDRIFGTAPCEKCQEEKKYSQLDNGVCTECIDKECEND